MANEQRFVGLPWGGGSEAAVRKGVGTLLVSQYYYNSIKELFFDIFSYTN